MRPVKLSNGDTIDVPALDKEQIAKLGPVGFSYIGFKPKSDMNDAEQVNKILSAVMDCLGVQVHWKDYGPIFTAVILETYGGDKDEEKNSSGSGPNGQTH